MTVPADKESRRRMRRARRCVAGFNATTDLLALVTAIVGAVVGANLALVLLDIACDRQTRDRLVETTATPRAGPNTAGA